MQFLNRKLLNSSKVMSKARQHAEDRLRVHLMKRHKVRDRKRLYVDFPRRDLYERYGLEFGACLGMKSIGKPCAGKPHARFDEGALRK